MDFGSIYDQPTDDKDTLANNHLDAIESHILVKEIVKEDAKLSFDRETSIYETYQSEAEENISDKINTMNYNFTYSASEKKLCFIGNDAESIPAELINQFGFKTIILDISFNCLSDLAELEQFPYIEELICDNNLLTEKSDFPKLDHLKLFSCNKNNIEDIYMFIEKIQIQFPNITYLTMLGNLACPNQLVDLSKDDYDYSRYRKYVLHSLRKLRFLDCYEITDYEKEIIQKEKQFYGVITYKGDDRTRNIEKAKKKGAKENWTPLPEPNQEKKAKSSFGYSKYVYHGKQSEGNRFILNSDL